MSSSTQLIMAMLLFSLETSFPAMDTLPSEVLLSVFRFLDLQSLGRVARVSRDAVLHQVSLFQAS